MPSRRIVAVSSIAGLATLATAMVGPAAHAAKPDNDDSLSNQGQTVTITRSNGLEMRIAGPGGLSFTVTCDVVSAQFTVPDAGLGADLSAPPNISSCQDTYGGAPTVATSGTWRIVFKDAAGESERASESNTGDNIVLDLPVGAATISGVGPPNLASCVLTLDQSTSSSFQGAYNDQGSWIWPSDTVNPGPLTPNTACPKGSYSMTWYDSFFAVSPIIHDVS